MIYHPAPNPLQVSSSQDPHFLLKWLLEALASTRSILYSLNCIRKCMEILVSLFVLLYPEFFFISRKPIWLHSRKVTGTVWVARCNRQLSLPLNDLNLPLPNSQKIQWRFGVMHSSWNNGRPRLLVGDRFKNLGYRVIMARKYLEIQVGAGIKAMCNHHPAL